MHDDSQHRLTDIKDFNITAPWITIWNAMENSDDQNSSNCKAVSNRTSRASAKTMHQIKGHMFQKVTFWFLITSPRFLQVLIQSIWVVQCPHLLMQNFRFGWAKTKTSACSGEEHLVARMCTFSILDHSHWINGQCRSQTYFTVIVMYRVQCAPGQVTLGRLQETTWYKKHPVCTRQNKESIGPAFFD